MSLLKLLRAKSWIKNAFVIFPAIFSQQLLSEDILIQVFGAFISFSLTSSVIYILNDIQDVEEDKLHPRKKKRPLPSGKVSVKQAYILALVIVVLNGVGSWMLFQDVAWVLLGYFVLNLLYVYRLKHVVLVDCFIIAVNFVLRVIYGAHVVDVEPSKWIITVTFFVALFLAFLKRRSEIKVLESKASDHRKVLSEYSLEFLNPVIMVCASVVIFSYLMYCFDPNVVFNQSSDKSYFSVLFVTLGIFRYLHINYNDNQHYEGDPTQLVYKDRILQFVILSWLSFLLWILY